MAKQRKRTRVAAPPAKRRRRKVVWPRARGNVAHDDSAHRVSPATMSVLRATSATLRKALKRLADK